jgi:hypothetical protein
MTNDGIPKSDGPQFSVLRPYQYFQFCEEAWII